MEQELPSKLLQAAVDELSRLPGVGKKTALRLALHLMKQPQTEVERFGRSFISMRNEIKHCAVCNVLSDTDTCDICTNLRRDHSIVCVVESIREVLCIENTQQYTGLYHVLGGIISPIDGVGPNDLKIDMLMERIAKGDIKEVVLALSTTMEGETTCYYLYKKIREFNIEVTTIARGVGFGDELEYTDELTLGRSIKNRQPFTLN
ncbi:MAG: recombination mediator RecR [Bacteroidales bacterium]|nr:recombination mediator RecR [Bacteroidales bacterium]MCL2132805.1 recombination mediator RecR [Bacteroidales bacterium]